MGKSSWQRAPKGWMPYLGWRIYTRVRSLHVHTDTDIWERDAQKTSTVECQLHAQLKIVGEHFVGGTKGKYYWVTFRGNRFRSGDNSQTLQVWYKQWKSAWVQVADCRRIQHHIYLWTSGRFQKADGRGCGARCIRRHSHHFQWFQAYRSGLGSILEKIELFGWIVDKISEIHLYAKIAWTIISVACQIVLAQKERNKSIDHLVEVMDIYSFMQRQSLSCFIRGYAINKKFCISIFVCDSPKFVVYNSREQTVKHFMSDTDNRTKQYQTKFNELKHCR